MKNILIFILLSFFTCLAYSQGRESYQIAYDPTIEYPEQYASYDCVNLLDSTDVTLLPNGETSHVIRRIIKTMNKRGAISHRILKHSYNPSVTYAEFYRVTVYKANGDVFNLDITEQQNYISPACMLHHGSQQIMMEVGHLDPGDIVDYRINLKGLKQETSTFHEIPLFESSMPIVRKVYKVHVPREKKIQFLQIPKRSTSTIDNEDERIAYTFIETDIIPTQPTSNKSLLSEIKGQYSKLEKSWILNPDGSQTLRIQMELDHLSSIDSTDLFWKSLFIYNPNYQKLTINNAYIKQKNRSILQLSPDVFMGCLPYEAIDAPDYNHLKEMILLLPEVKSVKKIFLDYSIHTQATYQSELDLFEEIGQSSPIKKYTFSVTTPEDKPLTYSFINLSAKPSVKHSKGKCTTQWKFRNLPDKESVSNQQPSYLSATTYKTQEDALAVLSHRFETEENMQLITIAEGLLEDIDDEIEQIKAIQTYVVDHFDNHTLPLSLSAYRFRPTDSLLRSAYGTEVEKANLLIGLLNNAGFIAEPIAMYASKNPKGLGLKGINRLYVSCKVGKENYLLSPTSNEIFKQTEATPFPLFKIHEGTSL